MPPAGAQKAWSSPVDCAVLATFNRGMVVHEDNFLDRQVALDELDLNGLPTSAAAGK